MIQDKSPLMLPPAVRAFRAAAFLGFLGVGLGAFGAHGLEKSFALYPKASHWWETAVFYHLIHVPVLLLTACLRPYPAVAWQCFVAGIILFSGSMYALALTRAMWLAYLTPLGGVCLLAGWLLLSLKPASQPLSTT